jgi:hypothetical protein
MTIHITPASNFHQVARLMGCGLETEPTHIGSSGKEAAKCRSEVPELLPQVHQTAFEGDTKMYGSAFKRSLLRVARESLIYTLPPPRRFLPRFLKGTSLASWLPSRQ